MPLTDQTRSAIESLLRDHRVVLFMKGTRQQPQCGFSAKSVAALDMLIPDYVTINVLDYPDVREGIKEYGNWPTIPQLYVDGELFGGSDIIQEMLQSGELADALGVDRPAPAVPRVSISERAADAVRKALGGQPGAELHLQIDAAWAHSLSLSAPQPGSIEAEAAGLRLRMDPWSAARADGLAIDLEDTLTGSRFVFDNPNAPPPVGQLTVTELKARLDDGDEVLLFDVRTDEERARAVIAGARHLDRDAIAFIEQLPRDTEIIFHCHAGGRSQQASEHFRRLGFSNVHNLEGGIQAWARQVDPSLSVD